MEEIFSLGGKKRRKQVYFAIENVRLQKPLKLWVKGFYKAIKIFSKRLALLLVLFSVIFLYVHFSVPKTHWLCYTYRHVSIVLISISFL